MRKGSPIRFPCGRTREFGEPAGGQNRESPLREQDCKRSWEIPDSTPHETACTNLWRIPSQDYEAGFANTVRRPSPLAKSLDEFPSAVCQRAAIEVREE